MSELFIYSDGTLEWRLDGKIHQEDGPAKIFPNGGHIWYFHDKFHRIDGPAIENEDGTLEWHIHDVELTESEFNKVMHPIKNLISKHKKRFRQARYNAVDTHLIPDLNLIVMSYV